MDLLDRAMEEALGPMQTLEIESYANMRQFRTATELREGKGNHIAASVRILPPPKKDVTQRLELSLVPADNTDQTEHMIHPNFLCINIKENRRITFRNDLSHSGAWKADFLIKNEDVFYIDNVTGNFMKVETLKDGNTLELGGPNDRDAEYLMLTIAYPLQKKTSDGGLTIQDIIQNRLQNDKNRPGLSEGSKYSAQPKMSTLNKIVKEFTKEASKVEINRCRLRACLYMDETDNCKVAEAISETINNTRDRNLGNFQVAMMSEPHFSCSKGGWKPFLVSKSKVGRVGFTPIFVFADSPIDENPRKVDDLFRNFKQISMDDNECDLLHNSTFVFKIPQQNPDVIKAIKQYHQKIYVTLFREIDQQFAKDMIRFDYEVCDESEEDCANCVMSSKFTNSSKNGNFAKKNGKKRSRYDSAYSTSSMVPSPMSLSAPSPRYEPPAGLSPRYEPPAGLSPRYEPPAGLSPRHENQDQNIVEFKPLSEEETEQILNSLGVVPNNQAPIDLGFGEISSTTPNAAMNLFNLDFDGSKISHDGISESVTESSDTSSDDSTTDESNDEDSEVFYLCKDANNLKVSDK